MKVFQHHIYEYKKGLRNLVLHTIPMAEIESATKKLKTQKIAYLLQRVTGEKINIFFGNRECVEIIRSFGDKGLNRFSDEEDFILGIMLGYCRTKQCARYLRRKGIHHMPSAACNNSIK